MNIAVAYADKESVEQAKRIAKRWQFEYIGDLATIAQHQLDFALVVKEQVLGLIKCDEPKLGAISVDFTAGAVAHRRKFGGGLGQEIAKAVGLKHGFRPHVLDATAGLGRDAFVLASLGCKVSLIERNPVVAALLEDGIERAKIHHETAALFTDNLTLVHASSIAQMPANETVDVVYLDPMYPHREKSAQVKKEMRVFQSLVGSDDDADSLLEPALALAKYRVVVKRPSYADFLAGKNPSTQISMKKNRFDVYVNQAIPK